jgi:hypothetical protein
LRISREACLPQLAETLGSISLQMHLLRPGPSVAERSGATNVSDLDGVLGPRLILKRR